MRITKSMLTVLQHGSKLYGWTEMPRIKSIPVAERRAYTQATIKALVRRRLIKYQPARLYVTGRGRKVLKKHQAKK